MNNRYGPPPFPRKDATHEASRNSTPARSHRRAAAKDENDNVEDRIKCTGKSCQACTAGLIADCVAVCCCPCALVNILIFTFFKVPWTLGNRIWKKGKEKKKRKRDKGTYRDSDGISRKGNIEEEEMPDLSIPGFGDESMKNDTVTARFEAEELWFESCQVAHLGFGRVSFTGISSSLQM